MTTLPLDTKARTPYISRWRARLAGVLPAKAALLFGVASPADSIEQELVGVKETWTDKTGKTRQTPPPNTKLRFNSRTTRALRAFVHKRDRYTCQYCRVSVQHPPLGYDGSYAFHWMRPAEEPRSQAYVMNGVTVLLNGLVIDHIIPWRDGGSNHPDNLQTLCNKCNKHKKRFERLWRERGYVGTPNDCRNWAPQRILGEING